MHLSGNPAFAIIQVLIVIEVVVGLLLCSWRSTSVFLPLFYPLNPAVLRIKYSIAYTRSGNTKRGVTQITSTPPPPPPPYSHYGIIDWLICSSR